jgi:hypothetical protein
LVLLASKKLGWATALLTALAAPLTTLPAALLP